MNPILNPKQKLVKQIVFRTKLYYAKADQRLRMPALPKELSAHAKELENRDVWVAVYPLDSEIEIELPWLIVKQLKHLILDETKNEEDIKEALAFIAFDVVNTYLRLLLPNIPSILFRDPEHVEVKKIKIEGIDGVQIRASGFTIYPTQVGEKITDAIIIEAELYNIPDDRDVHAWSGITVKINLRELLNELQIRWDISRM